MCSAKTTTSTLPTKVSERSCKHAPSILRCIQSSAHTRVPISMTPRSSPGKAAHPIPQPHHSPYALHSPSFFAVYATETRSQPREPLCDRATSSTGYPTPFAISAKTIHVKSSATICTIYHDTDSILVDVGFCGWVLDMSMGCQSDLTVDRQEGERRCGVIEGGIIMLDKQQARKQPRRRLELATATISPATDCWKKVRRKRSRTIIRRAAQ